jgi:hypothetical protein
MTISWRAIEVNRPLPALLARRMFLFPEGVNDKQHYGNRDARVCDVKRRPGIGVPDVQVKKEKIDHVPIQEAISEIAQNTCKKKRKRYIPPGISPPRLDEQNGHNHQCDNGNCDKKNVVAFESPKRRAGIGNVHQSEKIWHDSAGVVRTNESQDQLLRALIQNIERK